MNAPRTLRAALVYFNDFENCQRFMIDLRWPDGVVRCPTCGSDKVTYLADDKRWKCYAKHPRAKFSLKVGTVLEDSPIGLEKWLPAM
ncbi:MAG: transposase [Candidatus Binataceae bacterium]|nr:transposase [Candidatus Binataceae bacterium]